MAEEIRIDRAGRIVVPQRVREKFHLAAGDALALEVGDDAITLRPRRVGGRMFKERGIWVARAGRPISAAEARAALREAREQRMDRIIPGVG